MTVNQQHQPFSTAWDILQKKKCKIRFAITGVIDGLSEVQASDLLEWKMAELNMSNNEIKMHYHVLIGEDVTAE